MWAFGMGDGAGSVLSSNIRQQKKVKRGGTYEFALSNATNVQLYSNKVTGLFVSLP
jgi:hypothetical protein